MSFATDIAALISSLASVAALTVQGVRDNKNIREAQGGATEPGSPEDARPNEGTATGTAHPEPVRISHLVRRPRYVIPIAIILASAAIAAMTHLVEGSTSTAPSLAHAASPTAPSTVALVAVSSTATPPASTLSPDTNSTASDTPSTSPADSPSAAPSSGTFNAPGGPGLPNPYEASMQKLILNDPMTTNSGAWHNPAPSGSCTFEADGLHVAADGNNAYHECHNVTNVTDFTLEVSFTFSTATTAGLFFRDQGTGNSWYFAQVRKDFPTPYIGKGTNGQNDIIAAGDSNFHFASVGGQHTLAIVAIGPKLTLFVDHQKVANGTDTSTPFTSGPIGVFMVNTANGGQTIFRNARIWIAG